MKIAVISDVHGNMEALDAVLCDIEKHKCNRIFCLGDLALAGPEPVKTIHKFQEMLEDPSFDIELIQGNTDERLSEFSQDFLDVVSVSNKVMANAYVYDFNELSDKDRSFLAKLEKTKFIEFGNLKILLVHGSPRRNDENIYPDLSIEEVEEMLDGVHANLILCGHTHVPCGYQTNTNKTVVNVGSVGRPFSENPYSCYVVLDINEKDSSYTIEHKFVQYDYKSAANKLLLRKYEGVEKLAKMLESATSRYPE